MERHIFDEEHEMFRDSVRSFVQNEIGPHAERWNEQGVVDREAFLKAGEMGILCMWVPEEFGGIGMPDFRYEQIVTGREGTATGSCGLSRNNSVPSAHGSSPACTTK